MTDAIVFNRQSDAASGLIMTQYGIVTPMKASPVATEPAFSQKRMTVSRTAPCSSTARKATQPTSSPSRYAAI